MCHDLATRRSNLGQTDSGGLEFTTLETLHREQRLALLTTWSLASGKDSLSNLLEVLYQASKMDGTPESLQKNVGLDATVSAFSSVYDVSN